MLNTLQVSFNLRLRHHQLPAFRGAFADLAGRFLPGDVNHLFHNHNNGLEESNSDYLYRYPKVQYRVHNEKASLWALDEGAEALNRLMALNALRHFELNGQAKPLRVTEQVQNHNFMPLVLPADQKLSYRIQHYIPFTGENFERYKALPNFCKRVQLLEDLLGNHLFNFAKHVNWQWGSGKPVQVSIQEVRHIRKARVPGNTTLMAFDMIFDTNALLPDRMALGRKTAFGYGWLYRLNNKMLD